MLVFEPLIHLNCESVIFIASGWVFEQIQIYKITSKSLEIALNIGPENRAHWKRNKFIRGHCLRVVYRRHLQVATDAGGWTGQEIATEQTLERCVCMCASAKELHSADVWYFVEYICRKNRDQRKHAHNHIWLCVGCESMGIARRRLFVKSFRRFVYIVRALPFLFFLSSVHRLNYNIIDSLDFDDTYTPICKYTNTTRSSDIIVFLYK